VLGDADRITRPILLLFGEQDQSIPPADVNAIRDRLQELGKTYRVVTFPSGGHGFACDERASFNKESADQAWAVALEWLKATMPAAL